MFAIDTNVLVRFLVADDPAQSAVSKKLFEMHNIFIADTVLLETEWVLRAAFGLSRIEICSGLRVICGLPKVKFREIGIIEQTVDLHEKGLDFADAFHLTSSRNAVAFKTFDAEFIRKTKKLSDQVVKMP